MRLNINFAFVEEALPMEDSRDYAILSLSEMSRRPGELHVPSASRLGKDPSR